MEKKELLEHVDYTKSILLENEKLQNEVYLINHPRPAFALNWKGWAALLSAGVLAQIGGGLFLIVPFIAYFYYNKRVKEQITSNQPRVKQLEQAFNENIELLNTNSVIPPNYRYLWAIYQIQSYLVNQRADSFKECFNLLENDIKHTEHIAKLSKIQAQAHSIYCRVG